MSGYNESKIYYTNQGPGSAGEGYNEDGTQTNTAIKNAALHFLREWTGNSRESTRIYQEQLRSNYSQGTFHVEINLEHLFQDNASLAEGLVDDPERYMPLFQVAAKELLSYTLNKANVEDIQIQLVGLRRKTQLRKLDSTDVSRLVSLSGIVVSASSIQPKAKKLAIVCRSCDHRAFIDVKEGFGGIQLPISCSNPDRDANLGVCPRDPYMPAPDFSTFYDHQRMKIQELPELVPHGDMPRHLELSLNRYLVSKAKPGSRVDVTGIYSTFQAKTAKGEGNSAGVRQPYLRVCGIQIFSNEMQNFTAEDEEEMIALSRSRPAAGNGSIYDLVCESLAPSIFGHEDIKKAITCQLFGGSQKFLPDGMKLRGDINVLLMGDPSVAKSQFLKFVHKVSPVAVYTSGKGSSAAGLTASVIKDPASGDFHLEGGALVLGDGGIVCIDEFDKMRPQDRVAIHEAMEQQTISIAKAGITTILNARSAILAAANPIQGRYNDLLSPGENISLETTILSRFDMIFVLLDRSNREKDMMLSKHIMGLHQKANSSKDDEQVPVPIELMRKYITYCRQRCSPRLSDEAAELLKNHYVQIRAASKENNDVSSPIPITVRQLEAIVRISEALARIELSRVASPRHVTEAIRLFKASTLAAMESGLSLEGYESNEMREETMQAESFLKSRLGIGMSSSKDVLRKQFVSLKAASSDRGVVDARPFDLALHALVTRGEFEPRNQGRLVKRIR